MANPTSNYGWQMPTATDLVTDLPADFAVFGQAVDTSMAELLGGTTGQVLSKTSNTNMDFTWTTISAASMTLLSTTSLTGASTTISGISGAYTHLYGVVYGVTNATADGTLLLRVNGSSTATSTSLQFSNALSYNFENEFVRLSYDSATYRPTRTSANNQWSFMIENYANTSYYKSFYCNGAWVRNSGANYAGMSGGGGVNLTTAVTSLNFANDGGNFSTGTVLLYGVK